MTDNEIIKELNMNIDNFSKEMLDLINRQKAEIEKLKKENEFCHKTITENAQRALEVTVEAIETAKSEAVKEFAEKLKERLTGIGRSTTYGNFEYGTIKSYELDDLVKEMEEVNENGRA